MAELQPIPLARALQRVTEQCPIVAGKTYKQVTAKLYGKGLVLRDEVDGSEIAASSRMVVRHGQFLLSKIDARHGAFGLVPPELDGAVVTNDFPAFDVNESLLDRRYLEWMSKTEAFVDMCRRASKGSTNRVRLQEELFLAEVIPLPDVAEQRRVVARIEAVAERVAAVRTLRAANDADASALLLRLFRDATADAPRRPMAEVAPLVRRPVDVEDAAEYQELGIRSFGRGTFEKAPVRGSDFTWQKPYWLRANDLLFSNIKAWEGAVGVVGEEYDGWIGSHRYLTCVADHDLVLPNFLGFYFSTKEGVDHLADASPGSADRNRTLNTKALARIPVPVPSLDVQRAFLRSVAQVDTARAHAATSAADLDALLASTLDAAFSGQL